MSKRPFLLLTTLLVLQTPWLARPVHFEEGNSLILARGALADPWRPHDIRLNADGTEKRAFDVLAIPPGIAWWLAPVVQRPVLVQRAWMLPWLVLALFGAWRLGKRFVGDAERGAMVLLTAPIVFLSTPALLPAAPIYALTLAGVGGFVTALDRERRVWPWALLAGSAVLFGYSALVLAPVLGLYALIRGRAPWLGAIALIPFALLALHDLHAYGDVHLLATLRVPPITETPYDASLGVDLFHNGVASIAMLGGAAALPIFPWSIAAGMGAVIGGAFGAPWGWPGAVFAALGGAVFGEILGRAVRGSATSRETPALRDARWLALWALGGLLFLLTLRYTATRFWLPFLPAVLLALPTGRWIRALLAVQLGLGVLLASDDIRGARAQETLANAVAKLGTGVYTGHWGWQSAMEKRGWTALEAGAHPTPGVLVAMPRQAWPQSVQADCIRVSWEGAVRPSVPWIPRGYSEQGHANLHANWIQGQPPVRTVVPWTFANDPYERVRVCGD